MAKECKNCKYFVKRMYCYCSRYPEWVTVTESHYCGEHKEEKKKNEK